MDFLHCNVCGFNPSTGERRRFFLTSCGHVICNSCAAGQEMKNDDSCLVCRSKYRCAEICSTAKAEIKSYFLDPLEMLQNSVRSTVQILNFQRSQMKSYSHHLSKSMRTNNQLEAENRSLKDQVAQLKKQINSNHERQSPGFTSQGNRGSTPGSTLSIYGTPDINSCLRLGNRTSTPGSTLSTPDISSRLRQLHCLPGIGSGSCKGAHQYSQRQFI